MWDKVKKAGSKIASGVSEAVDEITDNQCDWRQRDEAIAGRFHTECGDSWDTPLDKDLFKFCPMCGKQIEWVGE